jgi:hypothetical protein
MVLFGPGSLPIPTSTAPLDLEKRGRKGEELLEQILREVLGTELPPKLTWSVMDGHRWEYSSAGPPTPTCWSSAHAARAASPAC